VCPKGQFLLNLATAIGQWQEEGDDIILMADMNEDVQVAQIKMFCESFKIG